MTGMLSMVGNCDGCSARVAPAARFCPQCGKILLLRARYRVSRALAHGGFGRVFAAVDTLLKRPVVIKQVASASAAEQQQVEREVHVLSHYASRFAFIPDIYDLWSDGAHTWLVMEFVAGSTLEQGLSRPWSPSQTHRFLRAMLGHLGKLHRVGIVHRDLKPSNIIRTPAGGFVLLDFGIAKHGTTTLAIARALSLDYAPLEQLQGRETDARTDLFSLGATAYHLLTGCPPLPVPARLADRAGVTPPSQLVAKVPRALERTLLALLELEPDARPRDAAAARTMLREPAP